MFRNLLASITWLFLLLVALPLLGYVVYRLGYIGYRSWNANEARRIELTISGGHEDEQRHKLVLKLKDAAGEMEHPLDLKIVVTKGSQDAVDQVAGGKLDAALIHGGVVRQEGVYQAATLITEPLHLFVKKEELADGSLTNLTGKKVLFGFDGDGTRALAEKVLIAADIDPVRAVTVQEYSREEFMKAKSLDLPQVVFLSSCLPSPEAFRLIDKGYNLMELPLARSLALREYGVEGTEIPEYTYSFKNEIPPRAIKTVGTRLMLVVGKRLESDKEAVIRLLGAVYGGDFARRANLPGLTEDEIDRNPVFPLSQGTRSFPDRRRSVLTSENIQGLDSLVQLGWALLALLFILWRVLAGWGSRGPFSRLLKEADRLRREVEGLSAQPSQDRLAMVRGQLGNLRGTVAREFALGRLRGRDQYERLCAYIDMIQVESDRFIPDHAPRKGAQAGVRAPNVSLPPT
jgi:TRAP-type uncharacterized transport system substrate-binding protein